MQVEDGVQLAEGHSVCMACNVSMSQQTHRLQQQVHDGVQLAEGQDVYQLLAAPYQDLWLHWLDEGNEAYKQQAKNSNQERLDFVRSVVAAAAAAASNDAATQNGSAEPTNDVGISQADQAPQVSIISAGQIGMLLDIATS